LFIPIAVPVKVSGQVFETIVQEIQDIPVVCEFPDVFPEDLFGLPPKRDVEFVIELKLGTTPISRRSYRMLLGQRRRRHPLLEAFAVLAAPTETRQRADLPFASYATGRRPMMRSSHLATPSSMEAHV
jgi:hypothetical protein